MNKKLIALALAALPAAAMADVTLYGVMAGSLQNDAVSGNNASQSGVRDNTSVIGFRGNEDLGNGLKTIWQVESRLNLNKGGGDTLASRETWLGLDGGKAGRIRLGYINNFQQDAQLVDQWQYASGYTRKADAPMNGSKDAGQMIGANGLGIFTMTGARLKNAIRYDTATFAGFSAGVMYGFGENKSKDGTNRNTKASNIAGAGLNYTYGPVSAHYAYQREFNPMAGVNAAAVPDSTFTSDPNNGKVAQKHYFEVDYNQDNLFVALAYAQATGYDWQDGLAGDQGIGDANYVSYKNPSDPSGKQYNSVGAQLKTRQAALSVAYTIGAFKPKFTYAKGWDQKWYGQSRANSGYNQYIAGVDYALSKRTTAGLSYGYLKMGKGTTLAQSYGTGTDANDKDLTLKTVALTFAHSF